jgi:hypothetical protein
MIGDPVRRGEVLAEFFRTVTPRLFRDLEESDALGDVDREVARVEWDAFALYACVRGLVAAGGFNRETAAAIDALHAHAVDPGPAASDDAAIAPRARIAERYAEYGAIGQAGGASGAATVTQRLGEAAARHMSGGAPPDPKLAETVGLLHETLAEGAAEAVRGAKE